MKARYIVHDVNSVDYDLIGLRGNSTRVVLLVDYSYWTSLLDELDEWLHMHNSYRSGMLVSFDSDNELILFRLRWE